MNKHLSGDVMKKILKPAVISSIILFCIYLCVCFANVRSSVKSALDIGINTLMPSLFPFFVISDMAVKLTGSGKGRFARIFSKLFRLPKEAYGAFICGILSGYPVGASGVYTLYKNNILTKEEAERMLCFSNNSGPLFVICAIGCGMLGSAKVGTLLYAVHIASAVITGMLCAATGNHKIHNRPIGKTTGELCRLPNPAESIEKGFMQCIRVIGFVIFFSVITDMILFFAVRIGLDTNSTFSAIAMCIIEITNGIFRVCNSFEPETAMCIISFACSFSGIGVLMQTALVTENRLSLKRYAAYKLMSGLISACLCKAALTFGKIPVGNDIAFRPEIIKLSMLAMCYVIFFLYVIKRYYRIKRR